MKRRILSCLLALALLCALAPFAAIQARAADPTGKCGANLTWSFDAKTGKLTITGKGDMYDWDNENPVPWSDYLEAIKTVSLPTGLTGIGDGAFSGCVKLTKAAIPKGVVKIGYNAFAGCTALKAVTIPNGVTGIGSSAFWKCTALTSVTVPEGVTCIEAGCFHYCSSLTSVVLPDSLTEIGYEAFADCTALRDVTLPAHLKTIGEHAFASCRSLVEITLPDGLEGLRNYSFYGCSGLRKITIPGTVDTVWEGAFKDCSGLTSVTIREGVTMIEPFAFLNCGKLAWALIPASVENLIWNPIGFVYDQETYSQTVIPGFKIYGFAGTNAESYAKTNGIPFCPIDPASGFGDVSTSAYYYQPMLWAVENGITNGTSEVTFSPNGECTRGQVVTFLWRANGSPAPVSTSCPFTDVKKGAYYYDAMLWAVGKGITTGTSATTFGPGSECTRAQIVTFLWRAAGCPEPKSMDNPFTDVKSTASYFKAVRWAVEKGITTGATSTTFAPNKICTRAQVVTFLWRSRAGK